MTDYPDPLLYGDDEHVAEPDDLNVARAAGWAEGYAAGRDDEADALPLRDNPYSPLSRSRKE